MSHLKTSYMLNVYSDMFVNSHTLSVLELLTGKFPFSLNVIEWAAARLTMLTNWGKLRHSNATYQVRGRDLY